MSDATLRRMIDQLREELEQIQYAVWTLEGVAAGRPRRGRPPKWANKFRQKPFVLKPRRRRAKSSPQTDD